MMDLKSLTTRLNRSLCPLALGEDEVDQCGLVYAPKASSQDSAGNGLFG